MILFVIYVAHMWKEYMHTKLWLLNLKSGPSLGRGKWGNRLGPPASIFFPEGGVGQTQAWMPAFASILRIPQMI
jgi:hypothetical protein